VAQAVGIIGVVLVHGKAVAVVLVEPVFRAKPHKAFAVLEDAIHRAVREALFDRDTLELQVLSLRQACPERSRRAQGWVCDPGTQCCCRRDCRRLSCRFGRGRGSRVTTGRRQQHDCDQQGKDERGSFSVLHRKHLLEIAAASLYSPMPPVLAGQVLS
jgi:hypothetical protein